MTNIQLQNILVNEIRKTVPKFSKRSIKFYADCDFDEPPENFKFKIYVKIDWGNWFEIFFKVDTKTLKKNIKDLYGKNFGGKWDIMLKKSIEIPLIEFSHIINFAKEVEHINDEYIETILKLECL